jgi:hypothetical protein
VNAAPFQSADVRYLGKKETQVLLFALCSLHSALCSLPSAFFSLLSLLTYLLTSQVLLLNRTTGQVVDVFSASVPTVLPIALHNSEDLTLSKDIILPTLLTLLPILRTPNLIKNLSLPPLLTLLILLTLTNPTNPANPALIRALLPLGLVTLHSNYPT